MSPPHCFLIGSFAGIDGIRPGNYVFLGLTAVRIGIASRHDIPLGVVAAIVRANEIYYIVDVRAGP